MQNRKTNMPIKRDDTIGLLTLVSADNCGSLLQAYAMKYIFTSIVKKNAELIPFFPYKARKMYRIFHAYMLKSLPNIIRTIKFTPKIINQKKDYNFFRQNYLGINHFRLNNLKELISFQEKYKTICVGSDQVWNVNMADFDEAYFLQNFSGKKIAYAASLGGGEKIEVPENLRKYAPSIDKFSAISTREPQGQKIIQTLTKKNIDVCIDPTLIVPEKEWDRIADKPLVNGDYIFFYSYNYKDEVLNTIVREASKKLSLPVYVINASRWIDSETKDFNLPNQGGPKAFLSLMKYAKYVFVQSLHGAIFASIFKRHFWFLSNRDQDILDQRSENILSLINARNRVLRPNIFEKINLEEKIDYKENDKLNKEREKSIIFLQKALI